MDTTIAFVRPAAGGGAEIVVNFGLLSGREATLAEVDRLARRLCDVMPEVRVHAIRTHDMGRDAEAVVHQVVVEAGPASAEAERLRAISEEWATDCAEERSLEPLGT
jgi:pyruvate-formate lyase-activating enzyme